MGLVEIFCRTALLPSIDLIERDSLDKHVSIFAVVGWISAMRVSGRRVKRTCFVPQISTVPANRYDSGVGD